MRHPKPLKRELPALQRSEHIAEWVRLTEEKRDRDEQVRQLDAAVLSDGRKAGPQHKPSGVRAASRDLGINEAAARRAVKIAENLHRAELTTLQRSEHIAEWVRLMEQKREREKLAQVGPVYSEPEKGGRGKQGGVNAASRDLGMKRTNVQRAVKIAERLTPDAKALAIDYGMADNQSAHKKGRTEAACR